MIIFSWNIDIKFVICFMSYEQTLKTVDDILRTDAGCATPIDYIEQTSWILFLKYLSDLESERSDEALYG